MAKFTEVGPDAGEDIPTDDYPNGHEDMPDWESLWNAPDYASLITTRQSRIAREYTIKCNSILKALALASINAGDFPDAAALLHHGPPWTHATGQLADESDTVKRTIDLITSPSSPVVMFAITSIALVAQIMRNHETQIKQIPETRKQARLQRKAMAGARKAEPPRFTIKVLGRQWPIRFRTRIKLSKFFAGFRAQTVEPQDLTIRVFSDPKLLAALEKQGIKLVKNDAPA
jgi:hypothetical protein